MRAAVLHEVGATPVLEDFREPELRDGLEVVEVIAAGLNPVDVTIAAGRMPARQPDPPAVCGLEGIARLPGGGRAYFGTATAPFGAFAPQALVDPDGLFPLPAGLDEATAICLGISGLAAWLPLAWRAQLREGETVLVLGATGTGGLIAVQAAKLLGAGRVVAAGRNPALLDRARELGADETVRLDGDGDLVERIRTAAGGPVDVTVDYLWGEPGAAATLAAGLHARHVQIGNSAGQEATLRSAPWRVQQLDIQGYSTFTVPREDQRGAYAVMADHAVAGRLVASAEELPLNAFSSAWERQTGGPGAKLVLRP
jgi:NADPH:quinone reductase-like Zn-dependent oxidoreductase